MKAAPAQVDLLVVAGQSNAEGTRADAAGFVKIPELDENIGLYWTVAGTESSGRWITLAPQTGLFDAGHFGPEVALAREWRRIMKRNIAVFKFTKAGSSLYFHWRVGEKVGLFADLQNELRTSIELLRQDGNSVALKCFVWIQSIVEPETNTTIFGRDAVGNMTSRSVNGQSSGVYSYDGLNRVTRIDFGGTAGSVTFGYDDRSKLKDVSNPTANRHYDYDSNGNLTLDRLLVDGLTFDVSYSYDGIDGLSTITYPGQMSSGARTVSLSPDAFGRPTALSPYLSTISYRPSGNLSSLSYANGVLMTSRARSASTWATPTTRWAT